MVVLSPETLIELFNIDEKSIDCAGIKLHLDKVFAFRGKGAILKETKSLAEVEEVKPINGIYKLPQGAYKIRYKEIVKVPPNAMALAIPRSTLLRCGATIFTAVWDPGYEGRGEGLMVVFNQNGIS